MDIGKKIKTMRLARTVTQDALAQALGVTAQAVSRWENGAAMPDITLLPALSVFFGVRIDDFFDLSDEAQLERIEHMTDTVEFLPRSDFDPAELFLKDRIALDPANVESLHALAALYNHRADGYHRKAEVLCKRALEIAPTQKAGHSLLSDAANGACFDWCSRNHRELIDYYYEFIAKNPDYLSGYYWLADNLIDDMRLDEALEIVHRADRVQHTYRSLLYEGYLLALSGDAEASEARFSQALAEETDNWLVWSVLGDIRTRQCRYADAVACFQKAAALDGDMQYIDNILSLACLCELQGQWNDAADYYERVLSFYRDTQQITEGFLIEQYEHAVLRCRAKAQVL